jgi:hypothetical protein
MINRDAFKIQGRLSGKEIGEMSKSLQDLYKNYKKKCGWLSAYGAKNHDEFLAECTVLYSDRGGAGLPKDVKEWFDKLQSMSIRK